MKTISIVIPTYNEEDHLPAILSSIKNQTLQPEEVIVSDNHSTDKTREIAKSFGTVIVDGGLPGPGRNRGAEVASGDYILFLDADVILHDVDFLKKALLEMEDRKIDLGVPDVLPETDSFLEKTLHDFYNWYVRKLERIHPHAPGFCMLVKKEAHKAINGFDETVLFCEDHDYALRIKSADLKFRVLSFGVPVSTRRFSRDGHFRTSLKFVLAEIYIWIFGSIRNNLFNYTFGHAKKDEE